MQTAMDALTAFLERRKWLVVGAWVALLVAALPFAMRQTEHLTSGGFSSPGSGSAAVNRALADFEHAQSDSLALVVARREGADDAGVRAAIDHADRVAARLPHVELSDRAKAAANADVGRSPIAVAVFDVSGDLDETADLATDLRDEVGAGEGPKDGVETYLVGQQALWAGMQDLSKKDLAAAEATGFPIVLLILLAVFGSLAAAALPLVLGAASVLITGAVIFFLSQAMDMSVFVTNVASMIGIGVAVDYSLFILARYREEIRAGADPGKARRIAMRTSGLAVIFSGVTVMVSLAGLFLVNSTTIRSMALGAIVVVAVSILAAVTFLPVAMRLFGHRAYTRGRLSSTLARAAAALSRRGPGPVAAGHENGEHRFWQRWTDRVMRRPVLAATVSAALLLALAIPALSLEFGDGALRQFPEGNETRVGSELAAAKLGAGSAGPTQITAAFEAGTARDPENRAALARYARSIERDPEVAEVSPPQPSRDGRAALLSVVPRHDPESPEARAMVGRFRDAAQSGALAGIADVDVGGATATVEDFQDLVAGSMWKIVLFVLALSYLVLFLLLRSVLLPLKAVLKNLLSVGAAYGVLVAIFQYGWIDGFLGFQSLGYINTMTPPLLLAIVFGLSMDYEVCLLSRIRERYDATGHNRAAVAQGLARSAATISSAALIMVAVFAVFAGTGVPAVKEIGAGLAVAIALDATLVRLVLVPATMELMGRWNWWLPRPLARIMPEASFEASGEFAVR